MLVPMGWAPTWAWRLHTNLYKFGEKASPHIILRKKNCCDQNLGESLCIVTFFLFSDSGLNLFNGFDFYFDLFCMAWHLKPAVFPVVTYCDLLQSLPCIRLARGKFKLTNQDSASDKKCSVLTSSKQVRKGFEIRQLFSLEMALNIHEEGFTSS